MAPVTGPESSGGGGFSGGSGKYISPEAYLKNLEDERMAEALRQTATVEMRINDLSGLVSNIVAAFLKPLLETVRRMGEDLAETRRIVLSLMYKGKLDELQSRIAEVTGRLHKPMFIAPPQAPRPKSGGIDKERKPGWARSIKRQYKGRKYVWHKPKERVEVKVIAVGPGGGGGGPKTHRARKGRKLYPLAKNQSVKMKHLQKVLTDVHKANQPKKKARSGKVSPGRMYSPARG